MPKVENAIIMAAGLGTRMRPLTNEIPKPLVKVNGKRMIETIIQGLRKNGITDISIVTGYLADKFEFLTNKYSGLKLINNPYYQQYNNLSSLYVARNELNQDWSAMSGSVAPELSTLVCGHTSAIPED